MWEVKVELTPEQVEWLEGYLVENEAEGWNLYVEAHTDRAALSGYFEAEPAARESWEVLRSRLPGEVDPRKAVIRQVEDQEWKESYKAHFHAWHFEGLHWAPAWERETFRVPEGEEVVWLDPGMAFGTGNHETTRLCMERLIACAREWKMEGRGLAEMEVLDAGCGSGILAISAVKCGFGKVAGFDVDPVAVEISRENARLNGVEGRIEFYEGDLVNGLQGRRADLFIANIQADVLCRHGRELLAAVNPGGRLILSGILATELEEVRQVFEREWPEADWSSREMGEWVDLTGIVP